MAKPVVEVERCEKCEKPRALCVCDRMPTLATKTRVLVLQHPQEPDQDLGTAKLLELALPDMCKVQVGLSWPSATKALGGEIVPEKWAILYPLSLPKPLTPEQLKKNIVALDRHGDEFSLARNALHGIIVLDGTWSQGKTLWWRNPWMLKHPRLLVAPTEPSIYGRMRKEPRREFVSTLESVAEALVGNGEPEETRGELRKLMRTMIQRARDVKTKAPRKPQRSRPNYND